MKTSIDYGFMLVFLVCLFACCVCKEEAKDENVLLRGGASSAIEKSLPDSVLVPTIDNAQSLNQDNEKAEKAMTIHDVTNKNLDNDENNEIQIRSLHDHVDCRWAWVRTEVAAGTDGKISFKLEWKNVCLKKIPKLIKVCVKAQEEDQDSPTLVEGAIVKCFDADWPNYEFLADELVTDHTRSDGCAILEYDWDPYIKLPDIFNPDIYCEVSYKECFPTKKTYEKPNHNPFRVADFGTVDLGKCEAPSSKPSSAPSTSPAPTCDDPPGPKGCDDPHLWTWEGKMFDYHGQCDLIYTTCPKFDHNKGLHLHLRTQFVEPNMWSTISSIAVKIGEDVLEVQNNGNYYINGEPNALLTDSTNLSDHTLSQQLDKDGSRTVYKIDLKDNVSLNIKVRSFSKRDSLSFTIDGVHNHRKNGGRFFDDCVGLSSTWEHPGGERFLVGRSGTHYAKHEAVDFGPEWQVDFTKNDPSLFYEDTGHQLPHQECIDSPLQAKDQRHLKALHEVDGGALARQAEEACGHLSGASDLFDACFFDVLVTGDVTFAQEPWYNEGE